MEKWVRCPTVFCCRDQEECRLRLTFTNQKLSIAIHSTLLIDDKKKKEQKVNVDDDEYDDDKP